MGMKHLLRSQTSRTWL